MNRIPKIIHQIWSGIDEPLPEKFKMLGETWKENHPTWEYMFWDEERMSEFIHDFYPQYWVTYRGFKYNIQRWDAIRYLILEKIGGLYVDFDYECLEPIDNLLRGKSCCFSSEPKEHLKSFSKDLCFNNALMASIPLHPFMEIIVKAVFNEDSNKKNYPNKMMEVLNKTGPLILTSLYEQYEDKEKVYIIPEEFVSPFSLNDVRLFLNNKDDENIVGYLNNKLENAVAIHYFWGSWLY